LLETEEKIYCAKLDATSQKLSIKIQRPYLGPHDREP
jgi:hypothetical protein